MHRPQSDAFVAQTVPLPGQITDKMCVNELGIPCRLCCGCEEGMTRASSLAFERSKGVVWFHSLGRNVLGIFRRKVNERGISVQATELMCLSVLLLTDVQVQNMDSSQPQR